MTMKNSYTTAALFAGVLLISAAYFSHRNSPLQTRLEESGSGMDDEAESRLRWDQKRLAGPDGKIPDNIRSLELEFAATLPSDQSTHQLRSAFAGWSNRGPYNVGGRTRAFGVDILNENNLVAGTVSGAIWRSSDAGASWTAVTTLTKYHGISCMAQDQRPGHESTWYTGSGEGYGASASGGGAYYLGNGMMKSTDNGMSWTPIASTLAPSAAQFTTNWQIIWNIALDKHDLVNDVAYAATYGNIYRTTNGGTSWSAVRSSSAYFTDVAVSDSGVVYATLDSTGGAAKGIWRAADGVNYTNIMPSNFPTSYERIVMGFNKQNQNELYFFANTPHFGKKTVNYLGTPEWNSLWKYTYVSGNGSGTGGVWVDLSANLPASGGQFDKINVQGSYDMVVRVHPADSNTVYIGGTNLYRSSTAFGDSTHTAYVGGYQQFSHLPTIASYLNHHPDQHVLMFSPSNPQTLFSCNDGGVFKTTNDTAAIMKWTPLNNGYVTSMFYTVALDHASPGNNILIGGAQDNGSWYTNTTNAVTPWAKPGGGDGSYCAIADNQSAYYLSIQSGKMIRALLNGSGAVTSFTRIDPIGGKGYQFINPYVLDPNNNSLMYLAGGKYIWRNNNLGGISMNNTWDSISTNWIQFPDSVPTAKSTITALAISKSPANRLYYGTDVRKVYRLDNANAAAPASPTDITSTLFPGAGYVSCIAVDPMNADHLMVIYSNYGVYSIFYSSDGGTTFAKAGGNLEQNSFGTGNGPSIRWGSIVPVTDGYVYLVGTSTGLYATDTLKGLNTIWVQQGTGTIGSTVCDMIDFRTSDGMTAVATHAGGIYSASITHKADVATVTEVAAVHFDLHTYPNPLRDQCQVEFTLPKSAHVQVVVLDERGRLVSTLANTQMSEGMHTLYFTKGVLATGTYFLSLRTDEAVETRKMLIVN
jgi:hypothetical protein